MLKKIFITTLIAVACTAAYCQKENEFVEVVVFDTLQLSPRTIEFSLAIRKDAEIVYSKPTGNQPKLPKDTREELIRKIIEKQKIDTVADDEHPVLKEPYIEGVTKFFLLRFNSQQQFTSFINEVKSINNITGNIVSKKSDQEARYKEMLTKKLLEQALNEATYIAGQSKKSLVKLLQVKDEDMDSEKGGAAGWISYPPLSALANFYGGEYQPKIIILRKLRVTYQWQ